MEQKAFFITFEGGEGSGKTTHTDLFAQFLDSKNLLYYKGREPGGTEFSEAVRALSKDIKYKDRSLKSNLFLFEAARADIIEKKIVPALKANKIVILDRYIDSTIAYQSYAAGTNIEDVTKVNEIATDNLVPDLTIYLDIDPKVAFERKGGPDKTDLYETFDMDYYKKVRKGFLHLADKYPERIVKVDSSKTTMEVYDKIISAFNEKYAKVQKFTTVRNVRQK